MMGGQTGTVCPRCGSAAAVHSIEEFAALARSQLGGQPGSPAAQPQAGWAAQPQTGPPPGPGQQPGWAAQPQAGPPPGPGQQPGWAAQPQAGPPPGPGQQPGWAAQPQAGLPPAGPGGRRRVPRPDIDSGGSLEEDIAGLALGAVAGFLGRSIGRRVQRAVTEQVLPTLAARQQAHLQAAIEVAQRHPELRACFTDQVVFLAGGSRVLPLPNLGALTVEQADAIVAGLRGG